MSQTPSQPEASTDSPADRDLVLELNFVPAWARKPPSSTSFIRGGDTSRDGARRDRPRGPDRPRRDGAGGPGRPRSPGAPGRDQRAPRGRDAGSRDSRQRTDFRADRERRQPPLPLHIRFLPEERQVGTLVRRMRAAKRAYPLMDIVGLFLANPDACRVKLESDSPNLRLHQCRACGMVALERETLDTHLLHTHLGEVFERIEFDTEPSIGNFVCVARCGLTGELIGPPNHNTFNTRIDEIHRSRFPSMSFDSYRRRVEMVHDPEVVEAWRESTRKQTGYRRKNAPADAPLLKWGEAVEEFLREVAPGRCRQSAQASLPAALARTTTDERLQAALEAAWMREIRHPHALPIALRGALRRHHFHIFRAGRGTHYVTAVPPAPLDPARAIESIRGVLDLLEHQPGCTRPQLLETLKPGTAPDSAEASELLTPITWLVERGHIIEFHNGALAVPRTA
jgi:hypothetical protein